MACKTHTHFSNHTKIEPPVVLNTDLEPSPPPPTHPPTLYTPNTVTLLFHLLGTFDINSNTSASAFISHFLKAGQGETTALFDSMEGSTQVQTLQKYGTGIAPLPEVRTLTLTLTLTVTLTVTLALTVTLTVTLIGGGSTIQVGGCESGCFFS